MTLVKAVLKMETFLITNIIVVTALVHPVTHVIINAPLITLKVTGGKLFGLTSATFITRQPAVLCTK